MKKLEARNQKIIDAIIQKTHRVCPGALALIGVYGSFATGDAHEKSDLDLLVLINDDRGFQLSAAFIQEDLRVGHDLYCTTWEALERDAAYTHPNISKLMDSRIVYCATPEHLERLEALRQKVIATLQAPLSKEDFAKAESLLKNAEHCYVAATIAESMSDIRMQAGGVIYFIENALAMLNKTYFCRGTKRAYVELEAMPLRPTGLRELIDAVLAAETAEQLRPQLFSLIQETAHVFRDAQRSLLTSRATATAASLAGTYEEMFSNWRNKLHTAAALGDRHLALMSMASMQAMLEDIHSSVNIGHYDVMACYVPSDLRQTAKACDKLLERYLTEYEKAGISARRFENIDTFLADYLSDDQK